MTFGDGVGAILEVIRDGRTERLIELRGPDLHIGRHPRVGLTLDHPKVSLYHARVERRFDGSYRIVDLMSKNATLVDGARLRPFEPAPLREGSRIQIVDYEFIFHVPAARVGRPGEMADPTVLGSLEDLSSTGLVRRAADPAEALRGVLDVVQALGGAMGLDERLGRALAGLMAVLPRAERGYIATLETDGSLPLRAARGPGGAADTPPVLSRTIVEEVLSKGRALLIKDVSFDERFRDQESVAGVMRTAVCAPLIGRDGRPIGMVQLDGASSKALFKEDDMDLLAALAAPIAAAVENDRLLRERASWAAASEIQRALLPRSRPDVAGYAFWEFYRTVEDVGGDLYDYIKVEDPDAPAGASPRWCVGLGDVSGHGMPAAIIMAGVCPEVRLLARAGFSPEEILAHVNQSCRESGVPNRFVTMLLAELDPDAHRVTLASAGHPGPLIRRADGRVEVMECPGAGPPLGVEPHTAYPPSRFDLAPGDVVVFYSDGLVDAVDATGGALGRDRLARAVGQAGGGPDQVGEAILAALGRHARDRSPLDDLTIVCLGRLPEP
ncbi:SpoIIE family protein phosphatase [Paludisphaera sp.]|uniref:SpoIIE family protein phosphatase n=1 Tax=Paludisphaera sp. TaxID=2017432 RepID=UPI00301CBAFE